MTCNKVAILRSILSITPKEAQQNFTVSIPGNGIRLDLK